VSWLEHFPQARRSAVVNLFHYSVRAGASHPDAVLLAVTHEVRRRLAWCRDPAQHAPFEQVRAALQSAHAEALAYAESVLAWESLPADERERRKAARAREYQREHMRRQPPTDKQLGYIRSLGYSGPHPADRLAASELIDQLLQRKSLL